MGQEFVGTFGSSDLIQLSAADRGIKHLHQHLPDVESVWKSDLVNEQRFSRFRQDGRLRLFYLHLPTPPLLEINEFVVTGIAEVVIQPDPLRSVKQRLRG